MSGALCRSVAVSVLLLAERGVAGGAPPGPFDRCEALVRAAPSDREAWRCFEVEGQAPVRYAEAARRLERHRADWPSDPFPTLALGRLEAGRGGERADTLLAAAAAGFASRRDDAGESQALASLARLNAFRGRPAEARRTAEDLRRLAALSATEEPRNQSLVIDAVLAQTAGELGKAWSLMSEADPRLYASGPSILRRGALGTLAYLAWATGRTGEAIAAYSRLAAMLHEEGDRFREAGVLGDIVTVMVPGFASLDERRQAAEEALEAARESQNLAAEATALAYLADYEGQGSRSAERVERALRLARESQNPLTLGIALRAKALYGGVTDPEGAEAAFREALASAEAAQDLDARARVLVVKSRMFWTRGPRPDAIAASAAAMDAAEATRDRQPDSLTRARRFAQWARPYMELAGHLLSGDLLPSGAAPSNEDHERAFAALERMRARVLLDELDASRTSAELFASGPEGRRRDDILKELAAARQHLRSLAPSDSGRGDTNAAIGRLEREEAELRGVVARANSAFASLRQPVFPALHEIRAGLAADEALLVYLLGDAPSSDGPTWGATSWVLAISRQQVAARRVPGWLTTADSIDVFASLLDARQGGDEAGAVRLYGDFLRAAVEALPPAVRRIAIVPDRVLHALPFAALRPERGSAPFGETFEVSVVPSATVWWAERRQPAAHAARGVLVLADPARADGAPAAGSAPERAGGPARLPPLAEARREGASAVTRIGRRSLLLVGSEAAETALEAAAPAEFRVLHFAAHALLDDAHPDLSAIVLAAGRPGEDGLLHLREIAALKLPGSVVVVSGCRSAGGLVLGGEGPMGLARAFFQAGARAVVGSLRPLRDDEAAAFFDRFYAHLADGASVAGAVRLAQRDRRKAGAPAAAWAGIVTLGDGGSVPFPREMSFWPWLTAAVFLAAALLWFLRVRLFR